MAKFKHFAEHQGGTVELTSVYHDGHIQTTPDHFYGYAPDGTLLQCSRKIKFKSNPSRHECDSRCTHAKGRTMTCECSCGGKNHGRGY